MGRQLMFKLSFTLLALAFVAVVAVFIVELCFFRSDSGSSSDTTGDRVTDSLKFVVVVSRHGNRGAHYDYPDDPYPLSDAQYWPYGVNGLTTYGRLQMYNLGVKVRALYDGFLNSTYVPEEFQGTSTNLDRTLMSGEAFLAGLYPPKGWQLWDTSIPWQPTPLYSDSLDKLPVIMSCPRFVEEMEKVKTVFLEVFADNITELAALYNDATGGNYSGAAAVTELYYMWDKAISEETEGYTLADWTTVLYPDRLRGLIAQEYLALFGGTDEMARLIIGSFFGEMLGVMQDKANGSLSTRKLQFYSGHDSSLISLQVVLGVPKSDIISIVKAGSAIVFEVHQNSTDDPFTVQVLYLDGGSDFEASSMTIPCGDPCDLATLVNMTRSYYTDIVYDEECDATSSNISLQTSLLPEMLFW